MRARATSSSYGGGGGGGGFAAFRGRFRTPSIWTMRTQLSGDFLGALDGQHVLVIEGSRCQLASRDMLWTNTCVSLTVTTTMTTTIMTTTTTTQPPQPPGSRISWPNTAGSDAGTPLGPAGEQAQRTSQAEDGHVLCVVLLLLKEEKEEEEEKER